jgi:hypothetical protein
VKVVHGEGALENNLDGADYYWIKRGSGEVYKDVTDTQRSQITFEEGKELERKTAATIQKKRKLTAAQLMKLGKLAKDIQQHFFFPQKATVLLSGEKFSIIDCQPLHSTPHALQPTPHHTVEQQAQKPNHRSNEKKRLTVGMQYYLNPSGHLPHANSIRGFALVSAQPILTQFKGQLSGQKRKILGHELTHSFDFFLKHTQIGKGILFDFGQDVEDHDQVSAEMESLKTLRHHHPELPITLVASAHTELDYQAWVSFWYKAELRRSSHLHYALKITSPAPIYALSTYLNSGMDTVFIDLDAVDHALHGSITDTKRIVWSQALQQFFSQALKACEEHGVVGIFASARLIDRDMLSLLSTNFPIEWIAPSSHYTQLDEVFRD